MEGANLIFRPIFPGMKFKKKIGGGVVSSIPPESTNAMCMVNDLS